MAVEDLDRQDRLERLRIFRGEVDDIAQLDTESLIGRNIVGILVATPTLDLGIFEKAAIEHDNPDLHVLIRGVAAYRASIERDPGIRDTLSHISRRSYMPS